LSLLASGFCFLASDCRSSMTNNLVLMLDSEARTQKSEIRRFFLLASAFWLLASGS
jgi:hypothetical protein